MAQVLNLKRGDTAPLFRARCDGTVLDGAGEPTIGPDGKPIVGPISLATAASVKFLLKKSGTIVLSGAMTVEDQTTKKGWVRRAWAPTDLAVADQYRAEVEVTWSDGTVQTFPAVGAVTVLIHDDLG